MPIALGSTLTTTRKIGSTPITKRYLGSTLVWSSMDSDFDAYLAAGIANGSTMSASNQTAVNAFVVGCKTDGVWTALKASCLLCAWDSLAGALTPLVGTAPTNNNFVSGDYTQTTGLLGDGSTKFLGANRNSNADPKDDYHQAVWVDTAPSTTVSRTFLGHSTPPQSYLQCNTSAALSSRLRNASTYSIASQGTTTGLKGQSRSLAASYTVRSGGSNSTRASASTGSPSSVQAVFGAGITANCDARIAFYSFGTALDLALLDARLATLMFALT